MKALKVMPNNKIILGFTGQIASGKGTAVEYLKTKYGAHTYRFSTMLRDLLNRIYLPQSRENLQDISRLIREHFGEDTLAHVMAEDVKNDPGALVVIDGIRRPDDVAFLAKLPGFVLIHISADMEKRFERITVRGENSDDTTKTFENFKKDHTNEAELKITEIAKEATETIDNNGTLKQLHEQLDRLVEKYAGTY